jgi:tetratricopeptide (TPR) repeat protein
MSMSECAQRLGRTDEALDLYAAAAAAARPTAGFVSDFDYTWRPWDFLGVCLANSGRHAEAIDATLRSLRQGNPEQDRLRQNLRWSIDHIPG